MKNILIAALLSSLFVNNSIAQDYIPMAVEGAHWIVRMDEIETIDPVDGLWEYFASGDTTINSTAYKKIYHRDLVITQSGPPFQAEGPYQLYGFLRDDSVNRKVYAINLFSGMCPMNREYLMFDFSLEVGDTAAFCMIPDFTNFVIQEIFLSDVLGFSTRVFVGYEAIYEGLGSDFGLFEDMFAPLKGTKQKYQYHTFLYYYCRESPCMLLVSTSEITQFSPLTISPNPAKDKIYIRGEKIKEINLLTIYNHIGMVELQVAGSTNTIDVSRLPRGMYIVELVSNESKIRKKLIIQ